MANNKMLKEAKLKYPKGTTCECLYDRDAYKITSHNHHNQEQLSEYHVAEYNGEIWLMGNRIGDKNPAEWGVCVNEGDVWAKIIETPNV